MEGAIIPAKGNAYGETASGVNHREDSQEGLSPRPSLTVAVLQTSPQRAPANLNEPGGPFAAGLAADHEEIAAGRELAARFVRKPGESGPAKRRDLRLMPLLAAGAVLVSAAGASAVYFHKPGSPAPAPSALAAIPSAGPSKMPGLKEEQEAKTLASPANNSTGDADSWAAAVETFRMLAREQADYSQQEKAEEPAQEQLAGAYRPEFPR